MDDETHTNTNDEGEPHDEASASALVQPRTEQKRPPRIGGRLIRPSKVEGE